MKKFTFKSVLDGFRTTVQQQQTKPEQEIQETLRTENFQLIKTFRHGFPHSPTALGYDPVQKLLAIGDKSGSLRMLGRPGVDVHLRHEGESACAVLHIVFLVNEGALVTATADDTLHLWNFRQKNPQVVQSLKFQRERISCLHLPVSSKWLYVGTEKGNIHVVHIESFTLSGYIINWNKAIDVLRKVHPGAVVTLVDNPLDANKLLIGYECGLIVLWDLRSKCAEIRWQSSEPLRSVAWHHEGKYFISSHTDGSLCTWPLRVTPKPQFHSYPHAKTNKDGKLETCKPIHKVDLRTTRMGDTFTIFSGGLSMEKGGKSPCITVLQGKGTTVLEMEHPVVDFITICESPWSNDLQEPYAIAVLLQNDLVLIDLLTSGFPCFESPYPMDIHESPVTCCTYLADCPSDLVPAFYSVGRKDGGTRKTLFSEHEWPVSGGEWSPASCSYSEIIITGHQDGSIKFWDSSAGTLQVLYKLKTAKIFERPRSRSVDGPDEDPLAIQIISLCAESRRLCIAGASGHVILFKFRKAEISSEYLVLEIPIFYENYDEGDGSPECEFVPRSLPKQPDSMDNEKKNDGMLRARSGPQRKPAGFQAQLICLTPWTYGSHPGQITSLCINSSYGLMAYGNEHGLVIVDIVQKICLLNVASPDLYGAQDPYSRVPKSPKRSDVTTREEQTRSPSVDQLPSSTTITTDVPVSPTKKLPSLVPSSTTTTTTQSNITTSSSITTTTTTTAPDTSKISRPPSPANEADESLTLSSTVAATTTTTTTTKVNTIGGDISGIPVTEEIITPEEIQKIELAQTRRKSSSWKGFKRQLSKVNMKLTNTFSDSGGSASNSGGGGGGSSKRGSIFYYGPMEGTPLSPVEISPDTLTNSNNSSNSPTTVDNKPDFITELEKDIVQSIDELETIKGSYSKDNSNTDNTDNSNRSDDTQINDIESSSANVTDYSDTEDYEGGGGGGDTNTIGDGNRIDSSIKSNKKHSLAQSVPKSILLQQQLQQQQDSNVKLSSSDTTDPKKQHRTMSQSHVMPISTTNNNNNSNNNNNKRVEFIEEPIVKATVATTVEGGRMSRPADLTLFDDHGKPIRPPRTNKTNKRDQRLLSVPNIKYTRQDITQLKDLRGKSDKDQTTTSFAGNIIRRFSRVDKLDSSFSRSRSSSMSSLENITSESITCLAFTDSYTKKSDPSTLLPTLWVGTSLGSVLTVSITLPDSDVRKGQPVLVSILGGPIFRLKGSILSMSFLDCNGALIPYSYEPWKDENRTSGGGGGGGGGGDNNKRDRTPTKSSIRMSPTLSGGTTGGGGGGGGAGGVGVGDSFSDRQFIVITSEKQARVVALPSQNCVYRQQIADTDYVIKAEIISMKDSVCLVCYITNGHLLAYSLPSLRLLMDVDFLPLADLRISKTFCFSNRGHGLYLATPAEIQKFTVCSEFCQFMNEMIGDLFLPHEMPEQPKESFFKGLFGGGVRNLDREELFGETSSGKPNRSVAKHIPGPNLQELGARASTATSEISRAHQLAMERGDKLSQLEERTERMHNQAQEFGGTAHSLMLKYKDKKWYQL